jgi:hypothetical protein
MLRFINPVAPFEVLLPPSLAALRQSADAATPLLPAPRLDVPKK